MSGQCTLLNQYQEHGRLAVWAARRRDAGLAVTRAGVPALSFEVSFIYLPIYLSHARSATYAQNFSSSPSETD